MNKIFIEEKEFDRYTKIAMYGLKYYGSNSTDINELYKIYEYLKDKRSVMQYGEIEVPNAHLAFLSAALMRSNCSTEYKSEIEEFLKSDYIAKEIKEELRCVIADSCCSKQLSELINSERPINDFSKEEISLIMDLLLRIYNEASEPDIKKRCNDFEFVLRDYLFILDGKGPIEYIKERYKEKLPVIIIEKSGLIASPVHYAGYGIDRSLLGESHLYSIYKQFFKYYPDKSDEFVNMVNSIDNLTPTEFLTNYFLFIQNGMSSNFERKSGNISLDGVSGPQRDFLGIVAIQPLLKKDYKSEYYKWQEEMNTRMQNEIKKSFVEKVEQYKKTRKKDVKNN